MISINFSFDLIDVLEKNLLANKQSENNIFNHVFFQNSLQCHNKIGNLISLLLKSKISIL